MRRFTLIALILMASAATLSAADDPQATQPTLKAQPGEGKALPAPSVLELERVAFLRDLRIQRNAEFETALAAQDLRIEVLQGQLAASKSPSEQLALHRAIEKAKQDTQLQLLDIQARYADLAGNPELATEIRAEITRLNELEQSRQSALAH